jgi:hypothetical protein
MRVDRWRARQHGSQTLLTTSGFRELEGREFNIRTREVVRSKTTKKVGCSMWDPR